MRSRGAGRLPQRDHGGPRAAALRARAPAVARATVRTIVCAVAHAHFLGYSAGGAHEHADALSNAFTRDMIERMNERLGFPDRCPHGWPITPDAQRAESAGLQALSDLATGDRCEIVRLVEHDGDLLHWYYDQGLVPGAKPAVLDVQPAAGHLRVKLGAGKSAAEKLIADKAARGLIVHVAA